MQQTDLARRVHGRHHRLMGRPAVGAYDKEGMLPLAHRELQGTLEGLDLIIHYLRAVYEEIAGAVDHHLDMILA